MQQTDEALEWLYKADQTSSSDIYTESKNEYGIYFLIGMMYNWKIDVDITQADKTSDSLKCVDLS